MRLATREFALAVGVETCGLWIMLRIEEWGSNENICSNVPTSKMHSSQCKCSAGSGQLIERGGMICTTGVQVVSPHGTLAWLIVQVSSKWLAVHLGRGGRGLFGGGPGQGGNSTMAGIVLGLVLWMIE